MTGAAVNMALVDDDSARAVHDARAWARVDPREFWEHRYATTTRVWSGQANPTLAAVAAGFSPGRAIDLGCGEGGDAIWLAEHGWEVVGVDIASSAVRHAEEGLDARRIRFVAADVSSIGEPGADPVFAAGGYDLVASSFLHSPTPLDRIRIHRAAAELVAPGGHLLVVSHAAPPPWATLPHRARLAAPDEEFAALGLPDVWEAVVVGTRSRRVTGPDGEPAELLDGLILVHRADAAPTPERRAGGKGGTKRPQTGDSL